MEWSFSSLNHIGWRTRGNGTPIVLLRGLGRWSEHWCGFDDLLAQQFKVIAIDNRGFGMSKDASVGSDLAIDQLADDVAKILESLPLGPVVLVGVSLGGMLAISLTARYPHLVRKLVLVNSSVGGSPYRRITNKALRALACGFVSRTLFYEKLSHSLLSSESKPETYVRLQKLWSEIDGRHGLRPKYVLRQLLAARSFRPGPLMSSIQTPTLVIKGARDQFIDSRNSDWICQHIRGASLVHCQGGHELGLDQPAWLAETIGEWARC